MIDLAPVLRIGVFLVRPGLFVATAPAFGGTWAPALIRIGLTVMLGFTCMASVPAVPEVAMGGLSVVLAREALIGMALGFGVRVMVAAAEVAGWLTGFQLGFSYASIVDPQSGVRNGAISALYGLMTLMVFLAIDGHHDFLRALVRSYEAIPVGIGAVDGSLAVTSARLLGVVFYVGAQLAAPVVIVLLIVELGLGLASRVAPTLNLMAQGFPIRVLAGLVTLALVLRVLPPVVSRVVPASLDLAVRLAAAFK